MNRQIKFRAWLIQERQWADTVTVFHDGSFSGGRQEERGFVEGWSAESAILCQFTGLVDKNGKEIYEGDIVREGGHNAEVVFDIEFARFGYRTQTGRAGLYMFAGEVIGNIYENPELVTTGGR